MTVSYEGVVKGDLRVVGRDGNSRPVYNIGHRRADGIWVLPPSKNTHVEHVRIPLTAFTRDGCHQSRARASRK